MPGVRVHHFQWKLPKANKCILIMVCKGLFLNFHIMNDQFFCFPNIRAIPATPGVLEVVISIYALGFFSSCFLGKQETRSGCSGIQNVCCGSCAIILLALKYKVSAKIKLPL